MSPRERFEALRARYLAAQARRADHEAVLRQKYGPGVQDSWMRSPEARRRERLREGEDRARRKFFDHLQAVSPRDWSAGVPYHWLCEKLTFEDAVRPANEALSVVPPLAYGCTEHVR